MSLDTVWSPLTAIGAASIALVDARGVKCTLHGAEASGVGITVSNEVGEGGWRL